MSSKLYGTAPEVSAQLVIPADMGPGVFISGNSTFNGPFQRGFKALTAAVATFTSSGPSGITGTLTSITIPAGVTFPGPLDTITLASGTGIGLN
jgi:hypothetical protein